MSSRVLAQQHVYTRRVGPGGFGDNWQGNNKKVEFPSK